MSIKYSGSNALTYLLTLLNTKFGTKVDKVTGKGLSTNDLTDSLKAQYDNAERNIIVGVQKNGSDITPSAARKVNITVPTKTSDLTNDSGFLTSAPSASNTSPKMNGTATVGVETSFSRGDHIHPSDTTKVDKVTGKQLSTEDYTTAEKTKLSGIATNANNYTHPAYTSRASGLYKITVDAQGHVSAATAVAKADITNLGIPGSVPTISTDVETDSASDVKTASPKAVKSYVDSKVSATYKPSGSITFANLPTPSVSLLGHVYNITNNFTTNSLFVEGAGHAYPAGTNVVIVEQGTGVYMFDVLSGIVDLSGYTPTSEINELTNAEVQTIWDGVFTS